MKTNDTKLQKFMEVAGTVLMATYLFFMLLVWVDVPELIPVHFDISGMADRWGSRMELILVFLVAILLYAGLTWITRHPQHWNVPSAKDEDHEAHVYRTTKSMLIAIKVELLVTFFYISVSQVMVRDLHAAYLPSYLTILFGTLAYFLIRMYRIPNKVS